MFALNLENSIFILIFLILISLAIYCILDFLINGKKNVKQIELENRKLWENNNKKKK